MDLKTIMGMEFPKDKAPDFGSIRLVTAEHSNVKSYILNSSDVTKLDLITNAIDGSIAYCVDTGKLYIKHLNRWNEV
ncbi:MAG: hypothetical protein UHK60_08195 [Acutalibacteraceae bacterium]|nr:hypothetical protein [Acutalibacteraceae bacterium]